MITPLKLMVFSLDNQYFGLPLLAIKTAIQSVEITPIAQTDPFIMGVINFHGEIIPAINIRKLLGLQPKRISLKDYFIIIQLSSSSLILVVDSIINIMTYQKETMSMVNEVLSLNKELMKGIIKANNNLILVLDINKIFAHHRLTETVSP